MRFIYMPTLRHASAFSVASSLWNVSFHQEKNASVHEEKNANDAYKISSANPWGQEFYPEALRHIVHSRTVEGPSVQDSLHLQSTCHEAQKRTRTLQIPEMQKTEISRYIDTIMCLVENWGNLHKVQFRGYFKDDWMDHIKWSWKGTIDKRKTAQSLVADCRTLSEDARSMLALWYCMEDYMSTDPATQVEAEILHFWEYDLGNRYSAFVMKNYDAQILYSKSPGIQRAWFNAAAAGNEVAVEYFINRINTPEGLDIFNEMVVVNIDRICTSLIIGTDLNVFNTIVFLLNRMEEPSQIRFFLGFESLLKTFCAWPWNSFLFEVLGRLRDALSEGALQPKDIYDQNYINAFMSLTNKRITLYNSDWECKNIMRKFWIMWDVDFKRAWLHNCVEIDFPMILHSPNAIDGAVILRDPVVLRSGFIVTRTGLIIVRILLRYGKLDLLGQFIRASNCSLDEVKRLNGHFSNSFLISVKETTPLPLVDSNVSSGPQSLLDYTIKFAPVTVPSVDTEHWTFARYSSRKLAYLRQRV